jgi:hypothetical protein
MNKPFPGYPRPDRAAFSAREWRLIQRLRRPRLVQDFLRTLPYNFETEKKTCASFRTALERNSAHCLEGALVAATILEQQGYPPLLLSLESQDKLDHVLFIYQERGRWGSVARSRDPGLHGRKALFRSVRQLACSYIDTYVDATGRITGYGVGDLRTLGRYDWRFSGNNIWKVENYLIDMPHKPLKTSDARYLRYLRKYQEFKKQFPHQRPVYFNNRHQWL